VGRRGRGTVRPMASTAGIWTWLRRQSSGLPAVDALVVVMMILAITVAVATGKALVRDYGAGPTPVATATSVGYAPQVEPPTVSLRLVRR
jgi:hypothetical protein